MKTKLLPDKPDNRFSDFEGFGNKKNIYIYMGLSENGVYPQKGPFNRGNDD